jgi:hypothetical protein
VNFPSRAATRHQQTPRGNSAKEQRDKKKPTDNPSLSEQTFECLVTSLYAAGLSVEARDGDPGSILLFVQVADQEMLLSAVYQSR